MFPCFVAAVVPRPPIILAGQSSVVLPDPMRRLSSVLTIRTWLIAFTLAGCIAGCSYAPEKEVPPHPDYVAAAIDPEDVVEIETTDGREIELVVAAVEPDALVGTDGQRVSIADISRLSVRSWSDPEHPCGAGEPVGCSIPEIIVGLSDYHAEFGERFRPSCEQHDYCYRHGYATYGFDQRTCDDRFYADMKAQCGGGSTLMKTLESIADVEKIADGAKCRFAADQFYEAVRQHGHKAYRTTTSTVCEFDWTPPSR